MVKNPMQAKLHFNTGIGSTPWAAGSTDAASQTYYFDLWHSASIVNRKLCRQSPVALINNMRVHTTQSLGPVSADGIVVTVSVLPNTWVVHNAWKKAFELWKDQQKDAYDGASPSIKPKWQDFKVYMDLTMRNADVDGVALVDLNTEPVTAKALGTTNVAAFPAYKVSEDWDYSKIVYEVDTGTPVATERTLHVLGDTSASPGSFGLVKEYAISRAMVFSPDPNTDPLVASSMFAKAQQTNVVVEETITNLANENDEPPYDKDNYPGGASNGKDPIIVYQGTLNAFVGGVVNTGPFLAPCGLVRVDFTTPAVTGTGASFNTTWASLTSFDIAGKEAMGQ